MCAFIQKEGNKRKWQDSICHPPFFVRCSLIVFLAFYAWDGEVRECCLCDVNHHHGQPVQKIGASRSFFFALSLSNVSVMATGHDSLSPWTVIVCAISQTLFPTLTEFHCCHDAQHCHADGSKNRQQNSPYWFRINRGLNVYSFLVKS